jgi:hypothetical protein
MGAAEGIEIHEIKTLPPQQTIRQQLLSRERCPSQQTVPLQHGKIGAQQWQSLGIGIIGPETTNLCLQAVTQAAQTAACHQIQHPGRTALLDGAGQQHPEVPRRSGSGIKKASARIKRGRPFVEEAAVVIHQPMIR